LTLESKKLVQRNWCITYFIYIYIYIPITIWLLCPYYMRFRALMSCTVFLTSGLISFWKTISICLTKIFRPISRHYRWSISSVGTIIIVAPTVSTIEIIEESPNTTNNDDAATSGTYNQLIHQYIDAYIDIWCVVLYVSSSLFLYLSSSRL
jgi:hypothetical protein